MHLKKIALLLLGVCTLAYADPASHRKVASDIVDLISSPEAFNAGMALGIQPMLDNMKQQGSPEGAITEMKAAFEDWAKTDLHWEELKPQMIELYMNAFSESELQEILAFYRTPTGKKTLVALPKLMAEGSRIGQTYAASKQAALMERVNKVVEKYHLK